MHKTTIIGNTTWGNTLGSLLGNNGVEVKLLARTEPEAQKVNQKALAFSSTSNAEEALKDSELVIWVVPSQKLRENVLHIKNHLSQSMILMSAAKGLEMETGKRMSQVIEDEVAPELRQQICALSGPNLAREIAQGLPAASVIAAANIHIAEKASKILSSPKFLISTTDDITGVELSGALKNIIALGAGILDGLNMGDNTKAAFITWSWNEVISLGLALGARVNTFYGLAGLGDLIATCAGDLSRNHYAGHKLAQGYPLDEVRSSMSQVAEGIYTTMAVHQLTQQENLEAPISNLIYEILFENFPISQAVARLEQLAQEQYLGS
ncbi:MAG: NAD(P)-dependent glycerol-3-phosphate dehydrogenase [Dehalococcoidia bacterium]|nr:NAD(P)-dependent glycerol-3-phosphate dehydrogenase [Dehalococcoidia bacterium]